MFAVVFLIFKMNTETPKIGLVLGAGSSRGLAHLGVLKVLKDASIPISAVAGSSIGSLFGALYVVGHNIDLLIKMAEQLKQEYYIDFTVPRWGLVRGKKIEDLVRLLTKELTFEELECPFYVVAVDIEKGEEVVFSEGLIYEAVRASISIPGVFHPKRIGERLLVDGAVLNRLPVNVFKEDDLDLIIGAEVKYGGIFGKRKTINNIFDVLVYSIDLMQLETVKSSSEEADILIQPDLSHINPARFDNVHESITIGIQETEKVLPEIQKAIKSFKQE